MSYILFVLYTDQFLQESCGTGIWLGRSDAFSKMYFCGLWPSHFDVDKSHNHLEVSKSYVWLYAITLFFCGQKAITILSRNSGQYKLGMKPSLLVFKFGKCQHIFSCFTGSQNVFKNFIFVSTYHIKDKCLTFILSFKKCKYLVWT